jgi:signal transduction histidine kinase
MGGVVLHLPRSTLVGRSEFFRVSPGEIIADAMRTMQPLLDKRGKRLAVQLPAAIPVVRADPRRMAQVLVNLLSNASK